MYVKAGDKKPPKSVDMTVVDGLGFESVFYARISMYTKARSVTNLVTR